MSEQGAKPVEEGGRVNGVPQPGVLDAELLADHLRGK